MTGGVAHPRQWEWTTESARQQTAGDRSAPAASTAEQLRVLAALFGTGALLLLASLLLPYWPAANRGVLATIGIVGVASAGAFVLEARGGRRVRWLPLAGVTTGIVLVTIATTAIGPAGSAATATYYVFASGFGFYYLSRRRALAVTATAAAGYAAALWWIDAPAAAAQWVLTMGAVGVTGWVIAGVAQRRLREQRRLTRELEDNEEIRTAFLRALSHDLRSPLGVVEGALATLDRHGGDLSADQAATLESTARQAAAHLRRMLDDLLAVDRLRSGQLGLRAERLDLADLVDGVVADEFADADRVSVERDGSPVTALADEACTRHVVRNLVANALKYGPSPTAVEVTVGRVDGAVAVTVEDRGPGIPDDDKSEILEAFSRGSTLPHQPGLGLGLSIVAAFTALQEGELSVDDRPGGGASFQVRLPAAPEGNETPARS